MFSKEMELMFLKLDSYGYVFGVYGVCIENHLRQDNKLDNFIKIKDKMDLMK